MRFGEALRELEDRQPERMLPDLSRISALVELLREPQLSYPTIHVTGTNGKTTTTRLISALACAQGIPAGAYTSPHLESVTERLAVCGDPISEEEFAEEFARLLPFLREVDRLGERVTYFEVLTALAYLWFADKPVSIGVFEVGMGGTWDATNLVRGDVAVLCPVALDHPELGSTLRQVAQEKAGVIKEGRVAVCREQPEEVLGVMERRCRDVGAELLLEGRDFQVAERRVGVGGQQLSIRGRHALYDGLFLPLYGEHMARNAAAAVTALEAFTGRALPQGVVEEGLAGTRSPGRLEVAGQDPLTVLDGAHNPAGARALASALQEAFIWERLLVVTAVSGDKDLDGIVRALAPLAAEAMTARHSSPRSSDPQALADAYRSRGVPALTFPSVESALARARQEATEQDLVLVTGSLYTVADARRALLAHGP